jgi:hypothetical protein
MIIWTDEDGYDWTLCRCGILSWEEWQRADAELDQMLEQHEEDEGQNDP